MTVDHHLLLLLLLLIHLWLGILPYDPVEPLSPHYHYHQIPASMWGKKHHRPFTSSSSKRTNVYLNANLERTLFDLIDGGLGNSLSAVTSCCNLFSSSSTLVPNIRALASAYSFSLSDTDLTGMGPFFSVDNICGGCTGVVVAVVLVCGGVRVANTIFLGALPPDDGRVGVDC